MNLNSYPVVVASMPPPQPHIHTIATAMGPTMGPTMIGTPVHMMPAPSGVPVFVNSPPPAAIGVSMSPSAAAVPLGPVSPVSPATPGTPGLVYPVSPVSPYQQYGVRLAPQPLPGASFSAQPAMAPAYGYPVGSSLALPRQNLSLIYTQPGQALPAPGTVPLPAPSYMLPPPQPTFTQPSLINAQVGGAGIGLNPSRPYTSMVPVSGYGVVGTSSIPMQQAPFVNGSVGLPTVVSSYSQPMPSSQPWRTRMTPPGQPPLQPYLSTPIHTSALGATPSQISLTSHPMPSALGATPSQISLTSHPMPSALGATPSQISLTSHPMPSALGASHPMPSTLGATPSQISLTSHPMPSVLGASPSQISLTPSTGMLGGTMAITPLR